MRQKIDENQHKNHHDYKIMTIQHNIYCLNIFSCFFFISLRSLNLNILDDWERQTRRAECGAGNRRPGPSERTRTLTLRRVSQQASAGGTVVCHSLHLFPSHILIWVTDRHTTRVMCTRVWGHVSCYLWPGNVSNVCGKWLRANVGASIHTPEPEPGTGVRLSSSSGSGLRLLPVVAWLPREEAPMSPQPMVTTAMYHKLAFIVIKRISCRLKSVKFCVLSLWLSVMLMLFPGVWNPFEVLHSHDFPRNQSFGSLWV